MPAQKPARRPCPALTAAARQARGGSGAERRRHCSATLMRGLPVLADLFLTFLVLVTSRRRKACAIMFLTNLSSDSTHPSFFEMFAQGTLTASLRPALRQALVALSRHLPSVTSAAEHADEIFFLLLYVLERHYMREHDSTFAENFYSLKRVRLARGADANATPAVMSSSEAAATTLAPAPSGGIAATPSAPALASALAPAPTPTPAPALPANPQLAAAVATSQRESEARGERRLTELDRYRALFFLVIVPYLKLKADAWYDAATDPTEEHVLRDYENSLPWLHRVARRACISAYPYVHTCYEGAHLCYQVAYLFGRTHFFSPWLHVMTQRVRRLAMHDLWADSQRALHPPPLPSLALNGSVSLLQWVRNLVARTWHFAAEYAKFGIIGSIFVFKLIEWYYSADAASAGVRSDVLPIAPAPTPATSAPGALTLPTDVSLCPLCRRARTNAAAPICSGIAFCYPCIHAHVSQHRVCPVTLLPCSTDQIRKIFAD